MMIPRSSRLLAKLIAAKEFTAQQLAEHLAVTQAVIEQYLGASAVMPLSQQMLLADFVIARSTTLKREGTALQGQVIAAKGFHAKRTTTRNEPPSTWIGRKRR